MTMQNLIKGDALSWLLEPTDPGVRYLALRDLVGLARGDPQLVDPRRAGSPLWPDRSHPGAHGAGWLLGRAGAGYYPKYQGTVWSLVNLAQLGATLEEEPRLRKACDYMLAQGLASQGQFTVNGAPSGTADCLQGNLCAALLDLGLQDSAPGYSIRLAGAQCHRRGGGSA